MKYRQIILLLPESVSRKCLSVEFCSRTRTEVTVHRLHPVQVFILSLWVSCLLLQQDARRRRQFIDRKAAFDSQLEIDPSWWGCMVAGVWCSLSHRSQHQEAERWGLMLGLFSPLFQSRTPAHGMVPPIVRRGGDLPTLANPVEKAMHRCVSWLVFQVILDVCQVNNHCWPLLSLPGCLEAGCKARKGTNKSTFAYFWRRANRFPYALCSFCGALAVTG